MKTDMVELIKKLTIGEKDPSGNKVISVLAKYDEFCIYEIEHPDANSRIKVLIEGHDDDSERILREKFNSVKQDYIDAKGLLLRAADYETMKQKVAHTLATCLSSDKVDGKEEFAFLIEKMKKQHSDLVLNKLAYLLPCFFSIVLFFLVTTWWFLMTNGMQNRHPLYLVVGWKIFSALMAISLGAGMSMLISAKSRNFGEFTTPYYVLLGLERLLLACVAGAIAYIAIKSGWAFPDLAKSKFWSLAAVLVVSGFSESFIPGVLAKVESGERPKH